MPKTPDDFVFFWKPDGPNGWAGQWYPSPFTVRVTLPAPQGNGDGSGPGDAAKEAGEERDVDVHFPTAEHWMMAQKALLFRDREVFERIVGLPSSSSSARSSSSTTTPESAEGPGPTRRPRLRQSKVPSPSTAIRAPRRPSPKEVKALGRKVRNFDEETWARERARIVLAGSLHKFRQNAALRRALLATGERELVEASPLDRIWGIGMGERRARETCAGEGQGREGWGLNLLGRALGEARAILREEFKDEVPASEAEAGEEGGQ